MIGIHPLNSAGRQDLPSIRILINKICIAFSGLLSPNIVLSVISVNAAAAVLNWNDRKFCMLWNIDLPSQKSIISDSRQ